MAASHENFRQSGKKKLEMDQLQDITLPISLELGRKKMAIRELLELTPGKIVKLDRLAGENVDLVVNGKVMAKGEVTVIDQNFGIRLVTLLSPEERIKLM